MSHSTPQIIPALTLVPITEVARAPLAALLNKPRLNRRQAGLGISESHALTWTPKSLTFVVQHGEAILGVVQLKLDDEEPHRWELSITLDRHANKGDAGRCASVMVEYAYERLDAQTVWFWVRRDNIAAQRFGARLGFDCVCTINVPGGAPCELFELERASWTVVRPASLMHYLRHPVVLDDGAVRIEGRDGRFVVSRAAGTTG